MMIAQKKNSQRSIPLRNVNARITKVSSLFICPSRETLQVSNTIKDHEHDPQDVFDVEFGEIVIGGGKESWWKRPGGRRW